MLKKIFRFGKKKEEHKKELEKIYENKEIISNIKEKTNKEILNNGDNVREGSKELDTPLKKDPNNTTREEVKNIETTKNESKSDIDYKDIENINSIEKTPKEENKKEDDTEKKGFFSSLKSKLSKTREGLFGKVKSLFSSYNVIDEDMYEELEDLLIQSDIGMGMTLKIVKELEKEVKKREIKDPNLVYDVLKDVMETFLITEETKINISKPKMNVILVVGVNGVGKTTTIGKLASKYVKEGKKVVIGAGDTFRAAAIEQLEEWAQRAGAHIISHSQGSDPGAVVFDTLKAGENRGADIVILDTAGRLHNKNNLMKELEKINTIIKKSIGDSSYESLLVIDGTTGQNGLNQAKVFNEVTNLTGFIVTKLDGTAKGGIVFAISEELKKPIKLIGIGEGIEDLREFDSEEYIKAIFE